MASKNSKQWNRARLAVLILMDVHAAIKSIRRGLLSRFTASGGSPVSSRFPGNWGAVSPSSTGHLRHHREIRRVLRKGPRSKLSIESSTNCQTFRRFAGIVDETIYAG